MASSIFYTSVDDGPRGLINLRSQIYAQSIRNSDSLKWLAGKLAWATASVYHDKTGNKGSLVIPSGGGLGPDGLYQVDSTSKSGDKRLLPKPHIVSVKISSAGDWGSIKKCEMAFTCYSLAQLDANLAFCEIGADLKIKYGWSNAGKAGGGINTFDGKVYNFNYSVNSTGGWDCTVMAMAKGIDVVSGNIKGGKTGGKSTTDPSGLTVPQFDIMSTIKNNLILAKNLKHGQVLDKSTNAAFTNIAYGCLEYASSWGASTSSPETQNADASADVKEDEKRFYIDLKTLVFWIQKQLINPAGNKASITCNSEVTVSAKPDTPKYFISANPREVVFPGYNKYGPKHDFSFTDYTMLNGSVLDSSKIMISVDWLNSIFPNMGEKEDASKSADISISAFLGKVFDSVYQNSGKRIALSLTNDPKDKTGKKWLVVDTNYADGAVNIFTFQAFNKYSVCRSISLNSKVPSEMATAAFVAPGASAGYPQGTQLGKNVHEDEPAKIDYNKEFDELLALFDATEPPKKPAKGEQLNAGPTDANISSMQSILSAIFTNGPDGKGMSIPYPMGFSVTVDGVDGIVFGNTVNTNYLPSIYKSKSGTKIVFTVTTVEHNITIGDWTTTINTVCRLPV